MNYIFLCVDPPNKISFLIREISVWRLFTCSASILQKSLAFKVQFWCHNEMKSSLNDVNSFKFCIICFCSDIVQVSNESDEFHHRTKSLETPTLPLVWMKSIATNRLFFTITGTPHARTSHTQCINTSNDRYVCSVFTVQPTLCLCILPMCVWNSLPSFPNINQLWFEESRTC